MIPDWLAAIQSRSAAATAGPWATEADTGCPFNLRAQDGSAVALAQARAPLGQPDAERHVNADFIAHARDDVPALCALVGALGEALGRTGAYLDHALACASDRDGRCDCGYDNTLQAAQQARERYRRGPEA